MSLHLDLKRIFREGLVAFWRNKIVSVSAVLVMTMSLLVLSSLLFMNGILDFSLAQLQGRVDVNVYFLPDADEVDIFDLQEKIALIPEVRDISYVSKEEALVDFETRHAGDDLIKRSLEELGDNPLGASLNVRAKESTQYEAIIAAIESEPLLAQSGLVERINYRDNKKIIQRLNQFSDTARLVGFGVMIALAVIVILVIIST
ncbi:MAG: cell division protein FtsX, partial [Minisyncoccia bacterium]